MHNMLPEAFQANLNRNPCSTHSAARLPSRPGSLRVGDGDSGELCGAVLAPKLLNENGTPAGVPLL